MEKVSNKAVVVARKLRDNPGGLSAKELNSNYVEIHPLIERKYVSVTSILSTAIYILTDAGLNWIDAYNATPRKPRRKV